MKKQDEYPKVEVRVTRYGGAEVVDLQSMFEHPRFKRHIELLRRKKAQREGAPSDGTAPNFANEETEPDPTK